jgi:hypothetical protein
MRFDKLFFPGLALLLSAVLLLGCGKENEDDEVMLVRFHLQATSSGIDTALQETLTLQRSGLTYTVNRQPLLHERGILAVDMVRVASGKTALRFQFDRAGQRALYTASVAAADRALILRVNTVAIGVRMLDGPITDGVLYTFTELSDEQLETLVLELKNSVQKIHELKGTS